MSDHFANSDAGSNFVLLAMRSRSLDACSFSQAKASRVYSKVHAAMRFVYQLLFMLFSYSFGPVTPSITYASFSCDQFTRCAQNLLMPSRTSAPASAR